MASPVCAIIGYGPGLGAACAATFEAAGYRLALLSRSGSGADAAQGSRAYRCDAGDPEQVERVLLAVNDELGAVDVVLYNADLAAFGGIDQVAEADFERSWRVGVLGLFTTARVVGPRMAERGRGAIVVAGATAALRGARWTTIFAPTKAAQRILAQSLAKQLGPQGIHVAYMVIDGVIDTADTRQNFAPDKPDEFFLKPSRIAEAALMLARQDRSAWTFEMDLRPFGETW